MQCNWECMLTRSPGLLAFRLTAHNSQFRLMCGVCMCRGHDKRCLHAVQYRLLLQPWRQCLPLVPPGQVRTADGDERL